MTDTERKLLLLLAEECARSLDGWEFSDRRKAMLDAAEQVLRETERDEEDRGR